MSVWQHGMTSRTAVHARESAARIKQCWQQGWQHAWWFVMWCAGTLSRQQHFVCSLETVRPDSLSLCMRASRRCSAGCSSAGPSLGKHCSMISKVLNSSSMPRSLMLPVRHRLVVMHNRRCLLALRATPLWQKLHCLANAAEEHAADD